MNVLNKDLPITIQAFELLEDKEIFIAEQVVNNQQQIDAFTSLYAGKIIKAKETSGNDLTYDKQFNSRKQSSSAGTFILILFLVLIGLVIYGLYTGWIQDQLNIQF